MDDRTRDYYETRAFELAERYDSAGSSSLLPHLFRRGERVLDVGCGSGRNLKALLDLDIDAYGIEPSKALAAEALRRHEVLAGRIVRGGLPRDLPDPDDSASGAGFLRSASFDGILLSAVLMHIPDADLFESGMTLRGLLKPGGSLVVSVPLERDDVPEGSDRDTEGRLMILRPVPRIRLLFERLGFSLESRWETSDALRRPGVRWVTLLFRYRSAGVAEPVEMIERIINRDAKTATYKLALLRACCDVAQRETGLVRWRPDGRVEIPLDEIAEKWIEYYWPLFESEAFIPQTGGENPNAKKPIAFRKNLEQLIESYRPSGGRAGYVIDRNSGAIPDRSVALRKKALSTIRRAIVNGPVYYSGGGGSENKPFEYAKDTKGVLLNASLWREFSLLGHWIGDSVVRHWAEESRRLSENAISVDKVFSLLITEANPERNVSVARKVYDGNLGSGCVWSGKSLANFDVDHAIPYSLWRDNSLWNLLPADPAKNREKGDKLPSMTLIRRRRDAMIGYWEIAWKEHTERFLNEARKIIMTSSTTKSNVVELASNWQNPLYEGFMEAVETTAVRRGVERWSG